jgi:hypothetical protein
MGRVAQRCVVLLTPGRLIIPIPCPRLGSHGPDLTAGVRRVLPEDEPQRIAVVAFADVFNATHANRRNQEGITTELIGSLIPFLGYLIGIAYTGHSVIVFEGHPSALATGCRDADLVIVDTAMVKHLQRDWVSVATGVMRKPRILVFEQDGKIIPIEPTSAQPLAALHEKILDADAGPFDRFIRSNREPLYMLALWGAPPEASSSLAKVKRPWWWPFRSRT